MTDREKLEQIEKILGEYDSWEEGTGKGNPYKVVDKVRDTLKDRKRLTVSFEQYVDKVNKRNTNMLVNVKEDK